MRKLLLSVLLCLTSVVAWAQETVAPPTDATYYDYVLSGVATWPEQGTEDLQDNVVVAVKGNDVYVNGLCGMLPQAWVKGVRNGSSVTFAAGQYFGKDTVMVPSISQDLARLTKWRTLCAASTRPRVSTPHSSGCS